MQFIYFTFFFHKDFLRSCLQCPSTSTGINWNVLHVYVCAHTVYESVCAGMRIRACVPASVAVSSSAASKQPVSASTHNSVRDEPASQQERMPTQQTMPQPGTVGNGISGGLQMCQLECEHHVRYANEEENLLARPAWPIYPTAACHCDTRLVRGGLWWLQQFIL